MKVICIKNNGRKNQLIINKEYEGEIKYGFYINYIEIVDEQGFKCPIPTEYFKEKQWNKK